jgi:beta-N-acetylhexosaminidase
VALICNNREGALQILRGLELQPNPILHARLARLHGRHPVTLESLHRDPAWRQAVSAMRELEEDPSLSLEL